MTLSTIYTPSIRNVLTMFHAGFCLLLGFRAEIVHDMTSEEFTKMIVDDLRKQAEKGELKLTREELRTSLLSALDKS